MYANNYKEFYIWETVFTPNKLSKELEKVIFSSIEVYVDICGEKWKISDSLFCCEEIISYSIPYKTMQSLAHKIIDELERI